MTIQDHLEEETYLPFFFDVVGLTLKKSPSRTSRHAPPPFSTLNSPFSIKPSLTREFPVDYLLKEDNVVITMTDLSKETDTLGYSAKFYSCRRGMHD
jgi:hypothetical protein